MESWLVKVLMMQRPIAFPVVLSIVLAIAGILTYFVGIPLLFQGSIRCGVSVDGVPVKQACQTSFGLFVVVLVSFVAAAIGLAWKRFR
jgi:hypothetical protein